MTRNLTGFGIPYPFDFTRDWDETGSRWLDAARSPSGLVILDGILDRLQIPADGEYLGLTLLRFIAVIDLAHRP